MSNKCEFYNQTFLENLHNFEFDLSKKNVRYIEEKSSKTLDISKLENLFSSIVPSQQLTSSTDPQSGRTTEVSSVWTPYFINKENSKITHSNLARSTIIKSQNLGIEEIITFAPMFRDWDVSGDANMAIDWIITPILSPFIPQYGLLFWHKKQNEKKTYSINEIPINSVIYSTSSFAYQKTINNRTISIAIGPNNKLIKKNNSVLLKTEEDRLISSGTNLLPNPTAKYFDIQEYVNFKNSTGPDLREDYLEMFKTRKAAKKASEKDFVFTFTKESESNKLLENALIHISDGDVYSYIDSEISGAIDKENFVASKTYLSPVLYENYRQIYHHLTLDYKKIIDIVEGKDGSKSRVPKSMFAHKEFRLLKKLCYFLSTHPLLDRTTVSILQSSEIKQKVKEFINLSISSPAQEQEVLFKTLVYISRFFTDLHIPESYYDKVDLPKKLLTKYGARLRSSSITTLSYKNPLEHGENIKCNWDINALCPKDIESSEIYYNLTIQAGKYKVKSNIGPNNSSIVLAAEDAPDKVNTIPLWDAIKKTLINNEAFFSVGEDIEIDFNTLNSIPQTLNITGKSNDEIVFNFNRDLFLENTILDGSTVSFEWSKISGPDCLRFGNSALTSIRDNGIFVTSAGDSRFYTSEDISPDIYIKSPGKYIIQCRISSNFGVFVDTVNIHVVNKNNEDFEIYSRQPTDSLRQQRLINLAQNNKNIITLPNIREFILGKNVFWPTYSDLSVLVARKIGRATLDFVEPLGSSKNKFSFPLPEEEVPEEEVVKKIFFSLTIEPKNCKVDMSQIILSNIYGPETPYCEPIYRCTMDNGLFDLGQTSLSIKNPLDPLNRDPLSSRPPGSPTRIATDFLRIEKVTAEKRDQLEAVMFDKKEDLIFDKYYYSQSTYASKQQGSQGDIVAYENFPDPTDRDYQYFIDSFVVPMKKTYFHPNSGLLETDYIKNNTDYNNKTSIIIGDHSKRNCKTFRGLGFETLKNESATTQIYSSSITLSMDTTTYDLVAPPGQELTEEDFAQHDKAFESPEFFNNYGYRNTSQNFKTLYSYTDELKSDVQGEPDGIVQSNRYCVRDTLSNFRRVSTRSMIYYYPSPGPKYSPKFIEPRLYDRTFGRSIGDLEIKLNYLNYINPKELVIWLDVTAPPGLMGRVNRQTKGGKPSVRDPYVFNNVIKRETGATLINNIPNQDIRKYLSNLFDLNNNIPSSGEIKETEETSENIPKILLNSEISSFDNKYSTILLNQDHIEFSTYNNILKFTDNTNNVPNNINSAQLISSKANNFVARNKNGELELSPTLSASNFSDSESYKYKTIIENNNLNKYLGANFFKLQQMPLFEPLPPDSEQEPPPPPPPPNSASITFTLNVAVVQESDDGSVYDRIINTDNALNINNIQTKNISNITTNSLCGWDLTLSNSKEQLNFEDKDVLGQIDFNNTLPKYDGYNFYGKIPNKLVPPVNLNAPNNAFFNLNSCFYSRESLTAPRIPQPPVLNITPIIYIPSFTLVGELANSASLIEQGNNQSREIVGFLNDLRRQAQQEQFNREIYTPKFENYAVGRSEKALISVSKDKKNWYKLEAGILRYRNCPILKNTKRRYKKIHCFNALKELAKFNINIVNSIENLIDLDKVKNISINKHITFNDIQKKSFFDKVKKEILSLEQQMISFKNNNREIPELLQEKLSDYKNFYYSVGPAGLEDDDIIKIVLPKQEEEEEEIVYYTLKIEKSDNIIFIFLGTNKFQELLKNNKSIFIDNSILEIYENLELTEEQQEQQSSNLVIIEESRPYFIYPKDSTLTFFEKKTNLENSEKLKIDQIEDVINILNTNLQTLLSRLDQETSENILQELNNQIKIEKQRILDKEKEKFLIEHIKTTNKLLSKSLVFKEQKLKTLFYLQGPIRNSNAFLAITPEENRIVVFDKDYYTKENDEKGFNEWVFANSNINRNEVITSSESTINLGSYGSGSKFNKQEYLYNSETPNQIKSFIENIEINIKNGFDHTELCRLFGQGEGDDTTYKLENIFTNSSPQLKKPYPHQVAKLENSRDTYKILDSIMNIDKYNAYFRNANIRYVFEANISYEAQEEGEIQLLRDTVSDYSYKLVDQNKNPISTTVLKDRTKNILKDIETKQKIIESNNNKLSQTSNSSSIESIKKIISDNILEISSLRLEYNHLSYYIDKCSSSSDEKKSNIIPNIFAIVDSSSTNKPISIMEESTEDYYIINIDAHQLCYFDNDKNPKIMQKIVYQIVGEPNRFIYGADPSMFIGPFGAGGFEGGDFNYSFEASVATYTFKQEYIDTLKSFYDTESSATWQLQNSERTFYLNGGEDQRGAIIKATYTYLQSVPTVVETPTETDDDSNIQSVQKFFNLDKTDTVYIDFKRIPRNLRNVDNIFDRHIPNSDGFLTKSLTPSPGGPVDASLKTWKSVDLKSGGDVPLPDAFKWMNLMKYIAFYKNYLIEEYDLDINQNMQIVRSRDEMELIPYDYKQ